MVRISNVGGEPPAIAALSCGRIEPDLPRNGVEDRVARERRRPRAELERIATGKSQRGRIDLRRGGSPAWHAGEKDGDEDSLMVVEHQTLIAI